jgi:hypothetical protein
MNEGTFQRVAHARLFEKSIAEMCVKSLDILALHPYTRLGVKTCRSLLNDH